MLQIHNVDEGKSEWNINETHIIIPMIDVDQKESEKILTSALTLNSLEGRDQGMLTNGLEHSLVIGLDKTLFETSNYKSDLVIIQNSDLKNPIAYTLSYVDQDKSEILWQSSAPKDRTSEKAILEVRDVLNYDVNELEKGDLGNLGSDIASISKTDSEILTTEEKKEFQYVSYYSRPQDSEAVLPQLDMTKFIESIKPVESKKIHESKSGRITSTQQELEINNTLLLKLADNGKTDKKEKIFKSAKGREEKTGERKEKGVNSLLYEERLPLKKKAKMKKTLIVVNSENQKSLLKQEVIAADQINTKCSGTVGRKVKDQPTTNLQEDTWNSDSDEPLINKVTKGKKSKSNLKKRKKSTPDSPVSEEEESNKPVANTAGEDFRGNIYEFDTKKFKNIYDLIECLRKCRMINATIWQTLHTGLKEMKVDILKEMNAKKNSECPPESINYSPQLKAFALVLYFKQPAAFNHLSDLYKTGWPSLNVIKEWKRRMNNHQRPNFKGTEPPK